MQVRAVAKYVGISHKKLGLVADVVRGMKVEEALGVLRFYTTPSALAISKVIKSAASNAENNNQVPMSDLKVVGLYIDKGSMMKRSRPQARGRVNPIRRRSSHITAVVDTED